MDKAACELLLKELERIYSTWTTNAQLEAELSALAKDNLLKVAETAVSLYEQVEQLTMERDDWKRVAAQGLHNDNS